MIRLAKIFALIGLGMICIFSCNDYSVSEKQSESFLKYYPIDILGSEGMEVVQSRNGGYVIMANYSGTDMNGTDRDLFLILTDEFGRQTNASPVTFGTNGFDRGYSILEVDDGYIVVGSSQYGEKKQGYLVKLGVNGQLIWQRNYQGYSDMELREVIEHQEGGYVMTGYSNNISGEKKVILLRTDAVGDSLWAREIGYTGFNDIGESLERFQDRILVVGTTTPMDGSAYSELLVLNTNREGKGIFAYKIYGDYDLHAGEIILDPSGNPYLMGNDRNPISEDSRIYVAKLELIGSELDQISVAESKYLEELNSVWGSDLETAEYGTLAISGWESIQNDLNIYFTLIDVSFRQIHRQTFGSKGYQAAQSIYFTNDNGYAMTGSVDLGGRKNMCIVETGFRRGIALGLIRPVDFHNLYKEI